MDKITAVWTGWSGGPGFSNFYFSGNSDGAQLNTLADRVHDFFAAITLCLPTPISINILPSAQRITPGDGQLFDEVPLTVIPPAVVGAGGPNFSSPVGGCVIWRTANNVGGRLVKGKTFLVPLTASAYDTDGTLLASRLTEIRTAAADLVAGNSVAEDGNLSVWHRPVAGIGGSEHVVVASSVNDRSAVLRSRRA